MPYDPIEQARKAMTEWAADINRHHDEQDAATPPVRLSLHPEGGEATAVTLGAAHLQELAMLLQRGIYRNRQDREREQRIAEMAELVAAACRDGEDPGELVGSAAAQAAGRMFLGSVGLTLARPGSWEASMLRGFACAGCGTANTDRTAQLARLLRATGDARDDGGDVLSQVLGRAADLLGGVEALATGSRWAGDLRNLAGQYATTGDSWIEGAPAGDTSAVSASYDPVGITSRARPLVPGQDT